jgi:hypothetical protein
LAAFQDFGQHFLCAGTDEPVAFFGDADGQGFVLIGVKAANYGSRRGERNFVFAGAAAKENADAEAFFVGGDGSF